jgi:citrate synthase
MAVMTGLVGALSAFYPIEEPARHASAEISAIRLIAKMPTLVAMAYKYSSGTCIRATSSPTRPISCA